MIALPTSDRARLLTQLAGNHFRLFDTAELAMAFLIEMDETLQEQTSAQSKP